MSDASLATSQDGGVTALEGLPRIDIVGLGPAGSDLVTNGTIALVGEIEHRFVRTSRHVAASLIQGQSFDHHYETHENFADVYDAIASDLVAAAKSHGRILYAVPGSPRVAEHTVELLAARSDVTVVVHAALSFLDLSWVALGIDPMTAGVHVIDGHVFAEQAAGLRGPVLVAQCHSQQVLSDIKVSVDDPGLMSAVVLQRLGAADEHVFEVAWADLDRKVTADHLTSIYIPWLPATTADTFAKFDVMVKRLRLECPWDAEQTHASLRRYLLEESYETLEALDQLVAAESDDHGEPDKVEHRFADLQEELGDLLYQIFFHSILATERGWFTVADVAQGIHDKLFERHPHVFNGEEISTDELAIRWEAAKRQEKGRASVMDGIPAALPALVFATKVQKKALAIGQSVPQPTAADKISTTSADEIGELLFAVVDLARSLSIDAEDALRQHAASFADHVRQSER